MIRYKANEINENKKIAFTGDLFLGKNMRVKKIIKNPVDMRFSNVCARGVSYLRHRDDIGSSRRCVGFNIGLIATFVGLRICLKRK